MQYSLPMNSHNSPAFKPPTDGRSPGFRAASKTLHIYCYDRSTTPYIFLQRLQLLYGRVQRAAIGNHREKRASGGYPPQRLNICGLNTDVPWILKTEFTTVVSASNAYNGILSSATISSNVPLMVYLISSFVLDEDDVLVDLSRVATGDVVGLPDSLHAAFQTPHNTIQLGERHNGKFL
jgi:hypothetical protein